MPIQTNFAVCTHVYHVPLPGNESDAATLNAAFDREGLKRGNLRAIAHAGTITLEIAVPFPLEALGEEFWKTVGKLVAATGEPWWDFCAKVVDHEAQSAHPHAHALSIHRVTNRGEMKYLHYEEDF